MRFAYGWAASSFIAAVISAQWWFELPSLTAMGISGAMALAIVVTYYRHKIAAACFGFALGTLWMASVGHWYMSWQLPQDKIHQNVVIEGVVKEIRTPGNNHKLVVAVDVIDGLPHQLNVRLGWYGATQVYQTGQRIRLCTRLKPAHGLQNPAGFDYWRWLVSRRIHAVGHVKHCADNTLLTPTTSLAAALKYRLKHTQTQGLKWIVALLLADRSKLTSADWQLLQRTGLAHLFTLSGLHMGIIYFLCLAVTKLTLVVCCNRLSGMAPRLAFYAAPLGALSLAWGFVAVCDWPLPLFRSAIGLTVVIVLLTINRAVNSRFLIALVFILCVVAFPFSIYGLSVYLSSAAVTCIVFLLWRFPLNSMAFSAKLKHGIRLQLVLSVFMFVVTGASFNRLYGVGIMLNLVAIPAVTLVFVPLGFIALIALCISPDIGTPMVRLLGSMLSSAMEVLAQLPTVAADSYLPWFAWATVVSVLVLILLPSIRLKPLWLLGAIAAVNWGRPTLPADTWRLHVFDVGQGSALLVQTNKGNVLIDTGPSYSNGNSAAQSVIVPTLYSLGISPPVQGVVSHFDDDHAGGMDWLTQQGWVNDWRTPNLGCQRGKSVVLGTVTLDVLWPPPMTVGTSDWSKNNNSCVIMVSDGTHRVLIPGDIEAMAEAVLVHSHNDLTADVMIAPHHGSKTSSSPAWVRAVHPQHVIVTNGYLNRWGFPHSIVVNRYRKIGAAVMSTAELGYMRLSFSSDRGIVIESHAEDIAPRWYKSR